MCFLFVNRILTSIPAKLIRGVKHVTWDDTYLSYDQDGQIVFAPSMIGETLGQLAAWNVMAYHDFTLRPVAGIVASACLLRAVRPGETLLLESVIDELDDTAVRYHSIARVGQETAFIVDGAIGPLLPMTNFIDVDVVRRQYHEINRPGDWDSLVESACSNSAYNQQSAKNLGVVSRTASFERSLMTFDHIKEIESGTHWLAEKLVNRTAPYFLDHFPNNPVLPMTVLLQCKLNLAHEVVAQLAKQSGEFSNYKVCELRKIKMNAFIHPGDVVVCHLKLKQQNNRLLSKPANDELVLSCQSFVDDKRVCIVDIVMAARELSGARSVL